MNKMKSLTQTRQPHARDCECGCADCPDDACRLDCLTRPNFFYGQALKDDDLTAIVEYTRARLGLGRFRDGWGVACGLHVDVDPEVGGSVIVNAGYAIDCCGNDIVVCDPLHFDLTSVLPPVDDCREPTIEQRRVMRPVEAVLRQQRVEERQGGEEEQKPPTSAPSRYVIDLYLKDGEKKTSPQTTLVRSHCRDGVGCEYSRVVEQGVLHAVLVESPYAFGDPSDAWLKGLQTIVRAVADLVRQVRPLIANLATPEDAMHILRLFRSWLNVHPLHESDHVRALEIFSTLLAAGRIPNMTNGKFVQQYIAGLIHLILNDMISHYVRCGCSACADENGIRLARILLLDVSSVQNSGGYVIYFINNQPPARRMLMPFDCHPAPSGKISLAHVLGKMPGDAQVSLASQGVRADASFVEFLSLDELEQLGDQPLADLSDLIFVDPTRENVLTLLVQRGEARVMPDRVVLFGGRRGKQFDWTDDLPKKETVVEAPAEVAGAAVDDLTIIQGIGPKFQERLAASGIDSFVKLKVARHDELRAIFPEARVTDAQLQAWIDEATQQTNPPPEA